MTLPVTIETGEIAQVFVSRIGYVEGMDTDGWGGVFPDSLVISCRRSRHSRTAKNVGARSVDVRNVGARLENPKRKMRRTCLEDPGLMPRTWP